MYRLHVNHGHVHTNTYIRILTGLQNMLPHVHILVHVHITIHTHIHTRAANISSSEACAYIYNTCVCMHAYFISTTHAYSCTHILNLDVNVKTFDLVLPATCLLHSLSIFILQENVIQIGIHHTMSSTAHHVYMHDYAPANMQRTEGIRKQSEDHTWLLECRRSAVTEAQGCVG